MERDPFWEFERSGWERAAARYEECWNDTVLFVGPLLDATDVTGRQDKAASGPRMIGQ
jgi:hypothetical protein